MTAPTRVLHIEDDNIDQQVFDLMVRSESLSWNVTTAGSLAEARAQLRANPFDVIVCDYHLPDGTSDQLFDEIVDVPFVLVSSVLDEQLALRTLQRGADDYLIKDPQGLYVTTLPLSVEKTLHRRQIRERERRATDQLEWVLDGVEDYAIYMLNPDGLVNTWNKGGERSTGYKASEILGKHFSCFFTEEDRKEGMPQRELILARENGTLNSAGWRVRKDGSCYWAEVTLTALPDQNGGLRGYAKISHDITRRRDLEQRYAERNHQLAQLKYALDQHAIVAVTDVQGTITYVNDRFCAISKYSCEQLRGQNYRILNSGHHPTEFFREMYQAIANGRVWHGEVKNQARDGSIYWADTTIVPTLGAEGTPRQYVAICADVTERKRAEEELAKLHREMEARNLKLEAQAVELQRTRDEMEYRVITRTEELARVNETLESSNIELQQFAYVASHDLQSPLRSISGFVQLLKMDYEEKLDDRGRDYIRRTVQSIAQMETLINDLLSYSRVESRSRPFVAVALGDVFHGSVSLLESSIRDAGGQVTCEELPVVLGDSSQLEQLMQNLIGNGLKYHGTEPPHVHVSAEPGVRKNEWIVSVRDNGIGIDAKYFGRIFEIFKRLHDQKEYPGTGIGLAVCRRVVERHGGTIWVESEPGHGSNFRFSIPGDTEKSTDKTEMTDKTNDQQTYQHEGG